MTILAIGMKSFVRNVAFVALLVITVAGMRLPTAEAQQAADVSSHPWIGEAAPDFTLEKIGGGELKLKDLKGKYVVIHFGASW